MKKQFATIACILLAACGLTACMDDHDEPNTDGYLITSPVSLGEVNYSIAQLKQDKASLFTQTQSFEEIKEDKILEGVIAANDCGGNLYQTLLLRQIDGESDQAIILKVKTTWLTPYFPLGQRIKVNLKGLYVGNYSKVPTIGQPYFTSSGNLRLGAMLLGKSATNVELVGQPNPACPECQPIERTPEWLRATANRTYLNFPQLVTVTGTLAEADGTATYAPEELQDAGYAVDRTITNATNNTKVTLRTSTDSPIAFEVMPQEECRFTGILTYYSEWQVQLRTLDDVKPVNEQN